MHLAKYRPSPQHRKWSLTLLGAMLCLASAGSMAAGTGKSNLQTYAHSSANARALGLGDDDCEEESVDLMEAATPTGSRIRGAAATAAAAARAAAPAYVKHAALTVAPAASAASASPSLAWEVVPADRTLNTALARWAGVAGWQLVWELPVDYAVNVRTEIRGTFAEAVGQVVKSMETAEIPMKVIFYDGNRVLRIVAKGTQ